MNDRHLKFTARLITIIIASLSIFYSWKLYDENHFDVPGTIIAKTQTINSRHHGRRVHTEYRFAVRPDNRAYKVYDVCVDFATFSTLGLDHISLLML